jgi:hypothetical protein
MPGRFNVVDLWALPAAGLSAHTAQALTTWPVSAPIANARLSEPEFTELKNYQNAFFCFRELSSRN